MIQAYVDDRLFFDTRLEDYALLGLQVTTGLNKSGTAAIILPPHHPEYDGFIAYRSVVSIYRDGRLRFRGRVLYQADDYYNRRTITCEGERGFLQDGIMRPYMYQDGPAAIFADVLRAYNAQVEAFKQFRLGEVTVTDPNNYVRLESETAEQISDTIDKLVERCGGYVVFTTNADGERVINWYAELAWSNNQSITFGSNLLDFARTGASTDLATVIVPYGAKDEETGERVTIESVNGGLDFIQDYDAVALRGVIAKPVYYDDITEPANLLAKAQQYLATSKLIITSLELTALDLSVLEKHLDSFQEGDVIHVLSAPHKVDTYFQLTDKSENMLDPKDGKITLGKDVATFTTGSASSYKQTANQLKKIETNVKASYTLDVAAVIEEAKQMLTSLIQQTAESIELIVSEQYATNDDVKSLVESSMTQLADSFEFLFTDLQTVVDTNDTEARERLNLIESYVRIIDGDIYLGNSESPLVLRQQNDRISFLENGGEVAYFTNNKLYVTDGHFLHSLRVGNIEIRPRENGNTSIVKVG